MAGSHQPSSHDGALTAGRRPLAAGQSATRSPDASGQIVKYLSPGTYRAESAIALAVVLVPLVGTLGAVALATSRGLRAFEVLHCLSWYVLTMFALSVGFHRTFAHRAVVAGPAVRAALAVVGSMTLQGPVIRWVADHRRHHACTDRPRDPHSPHVGSGGVPNSPLRGLLHAHMGWFFDKEKTLIRQFVPDLLEDSLVCRIDRLYPLWAILSLSLPMLIGWGVEGTAQGALAGFLWGGLVRLFLVDHMTWAVNSICHRFGTRPNATGDHSRNNAAVAFLTMGEGWHNDHHARPGSPRFGPGGLQVDLGYLGLRVLERLGLVALRSPDPSPAFSPSPPERVRSSDLTPSFLSALGELEAQLEDHNDRLNAPSADTCDARLEEEVVAYRPLFRATLDALAECAEGFDPRSRRVHEEFVRTSVLRELCMQSDYCRRIAEKPRGYAGDAEAMRLIYRAGFEGESPFGRFLNKLLTSFDACKAVRNRKAILTDEIKAHHGRILSLAAGPAEEILEVLEAGESHRHFLALDHDPLTRDQLDVAFRGHPARAGLANALAMMKGERRIAFPRRALAKHCRPERDFRGVRRLLAPLKYERARLRLESFSLVYTAGLYDYIRTTDDSARGSKALTRFLFSLVQPGGTLIIGNFSPSIPRETRFFMEYVCDWKLIYRDEAQVRALAEGLTVGEVESLEVFQEDAGIHSFLKIRRRRSC